MRFTTSEHAMCCGHAGRRVGFTLIELLTVIAIITLLIGILVPSLSRAREQAKAASTRAILKSAGDGLDLFRNENQQECLGGDGYPDSANRDDPTEQGEQDIFGAQWLVRYLLGKRLDGYVPKRNVSLKYLQELEQQGLPGQGWGQKGWYATNASDPDWPGDDVGAPFDRVGPYLEASNVRAELPKKLPGYDEATMPGLPRLSAETFEQPVLLDTFDHPILYYAANARLLKARKGAAPPAGFGCLGTLCIGQPGVYTFADNGLFTGLCQGGESNPGTCTYPAWDFAGVGEENNKLKFFGLYNPDQPSTIDDDINSFAYYVLNKATYESTYNPTTGVGTLVPYRPDSFILITPGPDGVFGTKDDITNF